MSAFTEEAVKLVNDVSHGKKLGEKSTAALVRLIYQMAAKLDYMGQELERIKKQ